MKREYRKPMVVFENFSMSTNIAGNCEEKLNLPSNNVCGYKPEGYNAVIFVTGIGGCEEKHDNGFYGLCYHSPSDSNNLFMS